MSEVIVKRADEKELSELKIDSWSTWECEPSRFDWEYDREEWCYLHDGRAKVNTSSGEVEIKKGDLVKFPKGLKCSWNVLEKVRKVYIFK